MNIDLDEVTNLLALKNFGVFLINNQVFRIGDTCFHVEIDYGAGNYAHQFLQQITEMFPDAVDWDLACDTTDVTQGETTFDTLCNYLLETSIDEYCPVYTDLRLVGA